MDGWADDWTCRLREWAGVSLITAGYPSMPQNTFDMFNRNLTLSCMVYYFFKKKIQKNPFSFFFGGGGGRGGVVDRVT